MEGCHGAGERCVHGRDLLLTGPQAQLERRLSPAAICLEEEEFLRTSGKAPDF